MRILKLYIYLQIRLLGKVQLKYEVQYTLNLQWTLPFANSKYILSLPLIYYQNSILFRTEIITSWVHLQLEVTWQVHAGQGYINGTVFY